MDLILAVDLKKGEVVHGVSGNRDQYKPLDWGVATSTEPVAFVAALRPKYLYIADLDRIERTGSHDDIIRKISPLVKRCYLDRGVRTPAEYLTGKNIVTIIGTETAGDILGRYRNGYLSIDVKNGKVIPSGRTPVDMLIEAHRLGFDGCIILSLGAVGTQKGIEPEPVLRSMRSAFPGILLYGGGVASVEDLRTLERAGFDGAIVATAVHNGTIPVRWIQEGRIC